MPTFAVTYRYEPDSGGARDVHRPAHVAFLRALRDTGHLYMSGPLDAAEPNALLILEDEDAASLEERLDADPFQREGLIASRRILPWRVFFDPREGTDR